MLRDGKGSQMSVINCALCQTPVDTDFDTTYECCEGCAVQSDEDREELAELRKDRARLDWANKSGVFFTPYTYCRATKKFGNIGDGWHISPLSSPSSASAKTFRKLIDAAMSSKPQEDAE